MLNTCNKAESTFCRKAHTQQAHNKANKQLLLKRGREQHGDMTSMRTTRPGTGPHYRYNSSQGSWEGTTLGGHRAFYSRGEPSSGAECASSPCSWSSKFPFSRGCVAASPSSAAVVPSGFSGGACGVITSGPHPMTGVPSRTWSSPIAGTRVKKTARNRTGYRGYRSNRPGPVLDPGG